MKTITLDYASYKNELANARVDGVSKRVDIREDLQKILNVLYEAKMKPYEERKFTYDTVSKILTDLNEYEGN